MSKVSRVFRQIRQLDVLGVALREIMMGVVPDKPPDEHPRSPKWEAKQKSTVRAHPYCAVCGTHEALEVHHGIPFSWDPTLELVDENLRVVCRPHHFWVCHDGDWKKVNPHLDRDIKAERARLAKVLTLADFTPAVARALKKRLGIAA